MTQQPYPQQYPQAPGYPPQQAYPPAPQYQAPPPPAPYPPQPQQPYGIPTQQPPVQPLATGTLDDYYSQPSVGGGPSISWKDAPLGTSYAGIVARDVTAADIQQQTNFTTKAPEFYRDGRPKFVMKIPLLVNPQQYPQFPEGEAALFVRGRMRDELVRAMSEAGVSGAPQAGAAITVTLVDKKQSGQGMSPANIFAITYTPPAGGGAPAPQAPAPVEQPQQAPAPVQPQQYAQPVAQQPQAAPAPVAQAPGAPQTPPGLSPEQAELLARLTGGQG